VQKEAKPKQHQQSFKRLGPHPPSGGRMSGALSLWLLSLSREQRESDSAGWPKPGASAHSVIALICKLKA
ncbi:hypothetical protein, partial [Stutzerimonas nitrititolerans]|uniref:hypothetical protein n=1 Tax=Stutzerimonas nitrititolerans TaxID=2482751 RepID=UPI002899373E